MTLLQSWKQTISDALSKAAAVEIHTSELSAAPDPELGDFAFSCFRLAKIRGVSPSVVAEELVQKLLPLDLVQSFTAAGPYLNIRLNANLLLEQGMQTVLKAGAHFGENEALNEAPVLFEYANPNTHKEIHIGHLRNFLTGTAILRIWQAAGMSVIPVTYVNDQGANVAKALWFIFRKQEKDIHQITLADVEEYLQSIPREQQTGWLLGQIYTEATKFAAEHPEEEKDISFVQAQLEAHEPAWERLWTVTRDWCLRELDEIGAELGVEVKKRYLESALIDRAQEVVDELVTKQVAKESQGALIVDLEDVKLGILLVRKSDGNLLYSSKDLALAEVKMKEFPEVKQSFILTDKRQNLYFKQLATVIRRLGYSTTVIGLGYELVTLKEGAMSSRKGNIVTYQALRDAVLGYAAKEISDRHPDWSEEKIKKTAHDLGLSGMKFAMLKPGMDRVFVFDLEEALSFEGATGPYCQYSAIRMNSILQKAGGCPSIERVTYVGAVHPSEKALVLQMASLPETVQQAAKEIKPSLIAQWCLELAQVMNAFYRDVPVLEAEESLKQRYLVLAEAARQCMENGLGLLGISLPEAM